VDFGAPDIFTVSGNPVTTSGTLTITAANQSANKFWVGPATGSAATPTFRSMVTADIPDSIVTNAKLANSAITIAGGSTALGSAITLNTILDSVGSAAQGDILYRNGSGWVYLAPGTSGNFLKTQGAGANPIWASIAGGDMLSANNLSDVSSASAARTNLGLAIGTNVQAFNSNLTTYAGIAPSSNVQTLLGAADYSAFRTSLGLGSAALISSTAGGDLSGTLPSPTVIKINGTTLSSLATGLLKNTTATGVPSIATVGVDYIKPNAVELWHSTNKTTYSTISAALTAAVDGDTIRVGPGTFTENSGIDLSKGGTATVHLEGSSSGRTGTIIQSTLDLGSGSIIHPGLNGCTIKHLRLVPNGSGITQAPIGTNETPGESAFTNCIIDDVSCAGDSDFISVAHTTICSFVLKNCHDITTKWDCINCGSAQHVYDVWDCELQAIGPTAISPSNPTRCVTGRATFGLHNVKLTSTNSSGGGAYCVFSSSNSNGKLDNVVCGYRAATNDSGPGTSQDLHQQSSGSITVANSVYSTTGGTITQTNSIGGQTPSANFISNVVAATTTGSGNVVLATSPTLVTPALGTPSAVNLSNAMSLADAALSLNVKTGAIPFLIDGGGSAITTGLKGYIRVPFNCTITKATLLADQSGSIVVNVWKTTYSSFDAGSTHPVSGDKITSSTPPTISSATKSQDSTLTSWTTSISAGDILAFNVDSDTTITRCTIILDVTK
jgi:hypothetical protein